MPPMMPMMINGEPPRDYEYYLIQFPDFEVIKCEDRKQLVEKIKEWREQERVMPTGKRIIMIQGQQLYLSKGEYKYIMFPDGERLPLFGGDTDLEPDNDGYLVEPSSYEDAPTKEEDNDDLEDPFLSKEDSEDDWG